jgi:outer membrane protein OmpA-like peptidoglycan-associated protein
MFVLKRIAGILNKFKDYKVTIEGHANNVTGTEKEEIQELIPLSEARAQAVKDILSKNGVDPYRLSIIGVGGRQPVVARSDVDNWWKNRRVEFILVK